MMKFQKPDAPMGASSDTHVRVSADKVPYEQRLRGTRPDPPRRWPSVLTRMGVDTRAADLRHSPIDPSEWWAWARAPL